MKLRVFGSRLAQSLLAACLVASCLVALPGALYAQSANAASPQGAVPLSQGEAEIDLNALIRQGGELESKGRWEAALTHYEEAIKQYPTNRRLTDRFRVTRMHYDLGRRYADSSFRDMSAKLTLQDALQLYDEVLGKVESHYVDQPDWERMVDSGSDMFEIAMAEKTFQSQHLRGVTADQVARFWNHSRRIMDAAKIPTRKKAYDAVHWAAYEANRQLGIPAAAAVLEYACGAANLLDDYTSFLSSGELDDLYSQIRGNFVGLGIELKANKEGLLILRVIKGSPAEKSGLASRDTIVAVDGRPMKDLTADQAADLLQGTEGSQVRVTVHTPDRQPRDLLVRREKVDVPSVDEIKMLDRDNGVAYFRLSTFQETTDKEVNDALWKLHRQGMRSLIIDLRGNPGGLLRSSIDVVDRFVASGVIVSTRGRNGEENKTFRAQRNDRWSWSVPLVVLIDGDSASASEIFAGAIRDHGRGTIVGRRSYGKGSVQGIFSFRTAGTGIRLTTAKFYSPKGHAFSKVGVEPHVHVRRAARPGDEGLFPLAMEDDPDISAAIDAARRQVASR